MTRTALLLLILTVAVAAGGSRCEAQDLSKVVAPLEQGDAGAAQAGLGDEPLQVNDPTLHDRLVKLHRGPVFEQLGKQGQAAVLYLEAVTTPDPGRRLELLKEQADTLNGTFVSPFVRYDLGLLYLAGNQLPAAVDNLQQAAGLARWHQPKLAARALQHLAAIAAEHPEYRQEAGLAATLVGFPRFEAQDLGLAGLCETQGRGAQGTSVAQPVHSGKAALRFEAVAANGAADGVPMLRLRPARAVAADRLQFWVWPEQVVPFAVVVNDADGTLVQRPVAPDQLQPRTWNPVSIDFAQHQNLGIGDYVLDEVVGVTLLFTAPEGSGASPVNLVLDDFSLSGTGSVTLANAPVGGVHNPGLAEVVADSGDITAWRAMSGGVLSADTSTAHSGAGSLRLSVQFDAEGRGGGVASAIKPTGATWNASGLDFWCLARDLPRLNVILYDTRGTGLTTQLGDDQLKAGQWCHVQLDLTKQSSFIGSRDSFGPVQVIHFAIGGPEPAKDFAGKGNCVWYFDDVRLTGQGPVPVQLRPRAQGAEAGGAPAGAIADLTARGNWCCKDPSFTVDFDNTVRHGPGRSLRLSGTIDPATTNKAVITYLPSAQANGPAERFTFWCFPRDVAFLPVLIYDADGDCVAKVLDERDLKVGEWNEVTLDFAKLPDVGVGDGKLDAVACMYFAPDPGWDTEHRYLKEKREYAWYLAGLQLQGKGPVQLQPREQK